MRGQRMPAEAACYGARGLTGPSLPLLAGFLNSLLVSVALAWEGGRDPGLTVTR